MRRIGARASPGSFFWDTRNTRQLLCRRERVRAESNMRKWWASGAIAVGGLLLAGCQATAATLNEPAVAAGGTADALGRLNAALAGEYDNDEQVRQSRAAVHAGTALAVPH